MTGRIVVAALTAAPAMASAAAEKTLTPSQQHVLLLAVLGGLIVVTWIAWLFDPERKRLTRRARRRR